MNCYKGVRLEKIKRVTPECFNFLPHELDYRR